MKLILGDNQFFGVNHFDLQKGERTKNLFDDILKIEQFITSAHKLGMDGFMLNSNQLGYEVISKSSFEETNEIHYSIPYPHKYANMVNETGLLSLGLYVLRHTSFLSNFTTLFKYFFTRDIKHIIRPILDIEVPKGLKKGSYIYMQNIITDLLLGIGRSDLIRDFIISVIRKGYKPGIITLNPIVLDKNLKFTGNDGLAKELIVCFNINKEGFNVFPDLETVESFIKSKQRYKLMGMSIFSSGSGNIPASIDYIKKLPLDYVVFGTSKLRNIDNNIKEFKSSIRK
ncbi:hypothetical protein OAP01_10365 [Akkermansiaceae bacterium]|nr:hypothetical protein [Akkermansiaceae bacterium]